MSIPTPLSMHPCTTSDPPRPPRRDCTADRLRALALFTALFGLLPRPAAADTVAILEFRVADLPPALKEQARRQVSDALQQAGHQVIPEEKMARQMKEIGLAPGCLAGPCLTKIGRTLEANRALTVGISAQGSSYDLTLSLMETGGGSILAQINQRCEVCNYKEVEEAVTMATSALLKQTLVYLSTHASLEIKSKPDGASVLIDSLPAGQTPISLVLTAGRHLVEIASPGAMTLQQEVVLEAGKTRVLDTNLMIKEPKWMDEKTQRSWLSVAPWHKWVALSAGLTLGGIGSSLWVLDGKEIADGRHVHDTETLGVTLVSLGAAAAVGALVFYWLEKPVPSYSGPNEQLPGRSNGQ